MNDFKIRWTTERDGIIHAHVIDIRFETGGHDAETIATFRENARQSVNASWGVETAEVWER